MSKHHSFWQDGEDAKPTSEQTPKGSPVKMGIEAEKLADIRRIHRELAAQAKEQEALKKTRSGKLSQMLQQVKRGHKEGNPAPAIEQRAEQTGSCDFSEQLTQKPVVLPPSGQEQITRPQAKLNRQKQQKKAWFAFGKKTAGEPMLPPNERRRRILAFTALCCLLAALAFGGTQFMLWQQKRAISAQVTAKLAEIESKNEAALALLDEKVQNFAEELQSITEALKEAGATIDSSGAANREAMAQRIEALDKQLKSLEESLRILEADKNGRQ